MTVTGMPALNAIRAVVDAAPGLRHQRRPAAARLRRPVRELTKGHSRICAAGQDRRDDAAQPAGDVADGNDVRHTGRVAVAADPRLFRGARKGGVGLITVGATGIDHHHPETPGGLHLGTDTAVDAHRALVEVVHEHGAKIQPQIVHAGPDGLGPEMHGVSRLAHRSFRPI